MDRTSVLGPAYDPTCSGCAVAKSRERNASLSPNNLGLCDVTDDFNLCFCSMRTTVQRK